MVRFYGSGVNFCLYLFQTWDVYIIIGRHAYRDAQALHGQLVMYVLKQF